MDRNEAPFCCILDVPGGLERLPLLSAVIGRTRSKALVIAPNLCVAGRWEAAPAREHEALSQAVTSALGTASSLLISPNPYSCAPVISVTYRRISPSTRVEANDENLERLFAHLEKYKYGTVVLDECHRMPDIWSKHLRAYLERTGTSVYVLGKEPAEAIPGGYAKAAFSVPLIDLVRNRLVKPYRHFALPEGETNGNAKGAWKAQLRQILQSEQQKLGSSLKTMVLTAELEGSGEKHTVPKCAISHLQEMIAFDENLLPVVATGASFLAGPRVAPEIAARIQQTASKHGWDITLRREPKSDYVELYGAGKDWNSRIYSHLACDLMNSSTVNCLIGTDDVFSCGFQGLDVNCVICSRSGGNVPRFNVPDAKDDTVTDGSDLVHIWHIGAIGDDFLHAEPGIADDGIIEEGPGQIHPRFEQALRGALNGDTTRLLDTQFVACTDRKKFAKKWQEVPAPAVEAHSVTLFPDSDFIPYSFGHHRQRIDEDVKKFQAEKGYHGSGIILWGVVTMSLVVSAFLLFALEIGITASVILLLLYLTLIAGKSISIRKMKIRDGNLGHREYIQVLANIVNDALQVDRKSSAADIRITERETGGFRVSIRTSDSDYSDAFIRAMEELTQTTSSGYLLVTRKWKQKKNKVRKIAKSPDKMTKWILWDKRVSIPSTFAGSADSAEVFRTCWERHLGPVQLLRWEDQTDTHAKLPNQAALPGTGYGSTVYLPA